VTFHCGDVPAQKGLLTDEDLPDETSAMGQSDDRCINRRALVTVRIRIVCSAISSFLIGYSSVRQAPSLIKGESGMSLL
jgi:hypothetical protein